MRRGLVIAGGGAKGAYSLGAMQALRERDFTFEAVAGTSAGALNAAIWATGDLDAGEMLWAAMSPESSYQRKWWLRILPRPLSRLFGAAAVLFSLGTARISGSPIDGRIERRVETIIFFILFAPVYIFLVIGGVGWFASAFGAFVFASFVSMFLYHDGPKAESTNSTTAFILAFVIACCLVHIPLEWLYRWLPHESGWTILWILPARLLIVAFITAIILCLGQLLLRPLFRITVLTSEPLRKNLESFLAARPFTMPVYATVATRKFIFDPDYSDWIGVSEDQSPGMQVSPASGLHAIKFGPWDPIQSSRWVPRYARLDRVPTAHATAFLLASSALPFGIVSPVMVGETEYVDGGVIDNFPILPLLFHELDEILILCLSPLNPDSSDDEVHPRRCADLLRLLEIEKRPLPPRQTSDPRRVKADPPVIVPLPTLPPFPSLRIFRPEHSLGRLFSGLLNFTPAYAKQMIALGRHETLKQLDNQLRCPDETGGDGVSANEQF